MDPFWIALALTTFAGLATVLGGVLAIVGREPSGRGPVSYTHLRAHETN